MKSHDMKIAEKSKKIKNMVISYRMETDDICF